MDIENRSGRFQLSVLQIALIASIGGFLMGYDASTMATTQWYFTQYFNLTPAQQGWAVSSAGYGCFLGAISAGYLTTAISRKFTLMLAGVMFVIASIGSGAADSLNELTSYRIILGLGIGMIATTAPMYIAEISPSNIRGRMVTFHQLAMVIGFLVPFIISLSMNSCIVQDFSWVDYGWRLMLWSVLIPTLIFIGLLFKVPHSPRWLMLRGKRGQAKAVLTQLTTNTDEIDSELNEIADSLAETSIPAAKLLFKKSLMLALFVGIMLAIFQQSTGIVAVLIYSADIFKQALNYGPEEALKPQLWVGVVNVLFTIVAIKTIDSWGRKPLLLMGTAGMFIGLMALGLAIYNQHVGMISVIGVMIFVGSFAMSMGPVVWVMLAEIFPNNVRGLAMSIVIGVQCLASALVTNGFPILNKSQLNTASFNGALPYFIFALICVLAILFVCWRVPETKGKTLEQMEKLWN
jgi:SP family xylose:H+ symportor-like MFS transporter